MEKKQHTHYNKTLFCVKNFLQISFILHHFQKVKTIHIILHLIHNSKFISVHPVNE